MGRMITPHAIYVEPLGWSNCHEIGQWSVLLELELDVLLKQTLPLHSS